MHNYVADYLVGLALVIIAMMVLSAFVHIEGKEDDED